ncbi:MAG TPA: PQQ-binding-like beta-propeller repeat protein, partial [Thermoplasmata archaeon]|nr:PQQ-binding-like beta-propeller repeat protein [Thermoplasmata archaeon]
PWWFALNASTGKVQWKYYTGNTSRYYNWASPLIVGGSAYIGLSSGCDHPLIQGELLMVNLTSHTLVHSFDVVANPGKGGSVWTSPTYDATTNTVFLSTGNGQTATQKMVRSVIALNATTLALQSYWQVPLNATQSDADFGTTPTLFEGAHGAPMVVATNKNGFAYALNRSNLAAGPVWSDAIAIGGPCPECGNGSASSAAYNGTTLFLAGGETAIGGTNYSGSVRAIDPATGAFLWEYGAPGIVLPALTYGDGLVVAGAGSSIVVLSAATGKLLYSYATGAMMYGAASIWGNCIYEGSTNGKIYAIGIAGLGCSGSTVGHAVRGPALSAPSSGNGLAPGTPQARLAPNSDSREGRQSLRGPAARDFNRPTHRDGRSRLPLETPP